ncbi:MAG TPA: hypothetical protein VK171_15010 [Fimbriimonas sp.]|nr:hypothetical protein [Fimbriimonas sp.]
MLVASAVMLVSLTQRGNTPTQRPNTPQRRATVPVVKTYTPTTDTWASLAKRDPGAIRAILAQTRSRAIPKTLLSGLATGSNLERLTDKAVQLRKGAAFTVDFKGLRPTDSPTEGVRDFGSMAEGSSVTTTVTGTTWNAGTVRAELDTNGKPSPFTVEYLAIKYWVSGFGDTNRSEKSKAPFESKAEEGDSFLASVRVDPKKLSPGIYTAKLKITTPDSVRVVPLKVTIVGVKQQVAVTEVLTPSVSFAAGEQRTVKFKLQNTGNVISYYTAKFVGGWNGLKSTPVKGALSPGQSEVVDVVITSDTTTTDGSAGLAIEVTNTTSGAGIGTVLFTADIKTIWKSWTYPLETLDGKVTLNATVNVSSSGIWVWRFNLRDKSVVTPDAHEMAFCFDQPIGGKRLGYYFKTYTKPGTSVGLEYSGVDARLQQAYSSLGNMNVILNSWDVVTSDPFFKIIEYEALALVSGPGALLAVAMDPIKDPTEPFTNWCNKYNTGWLKITGVNVK